LWEVIVNVKFLAERGKLAKKSWSSCIFQKRLNKHLIGKACKKPFINRETQHAQKVYAIHLHKPVEFWRSHMYSDECSFDTSARGTTFVTRLRHERYHDHCIDHNFQSGRASVIIWGAYQLKLEVPINFFGWYREAWGSGIGLFRTGVRTGGRARFSGLVGV
jgi:hypothetical protein